MKKICALTQKGVDQSDGFFNSQVIPDAPRIQPTKRPYSPPDFNLNFEPNKICKSSEG